MKEAERALQRVHNFQPQSTALSYAFNAISTQYLDELLYRTTQLNTWRNLPKGGSGPL